MSYKHTAKCVDSKEKQTGNMAVNLSYPWMKSTCNTSNLVAVDSVSRKHDGMLERKLIYWHQFEYLENSDNSFQKNLDNGYTMNAYYSVKGNIKPDNERWSVECSHTCLTPSHTQGASRNSVYCKWVLTVIIGCCHIHYSLSYSTNNCVLNFKRNTLLNWIFVMLVFVYRLLLIWS